MDKAITDTSPADTKKANRKGKKEDTLKVGTSDTTKDQPLQKSKRLGGPSGAGFGSFAAIQASNLQMTSPVGRRFLLAVELDDKCPLHCAHCIYDDELQREPIPFGQLIEAVRQIENERPVYFTLAGKEPIATAISRQEQVQELLTTAKHPSTIRIIMTNGLLLHRVMDWLPDFIELLDISLDGDQVSHDATRGKGTFDKTWQNVLLAAQKVQRIGVIATATANPSAPTLERIPYLQEMLAGQFEANGNVGLTVSLYYGRPNDPFRLNVGQLIDLMESLRKGRFPVTVLWTSNYGHLTRLVLSALGCELSEIQYDPKTALPVLVSGQLRIVLFNLSNAPTVGLRITTNGAVMESCAYLAYGTRGLDTQLGGIGLPWGDSLPMILDQTFIHGVTTHPACQGMPCWDWCRGGDPVSGKLENQKIADPYCRLLAAAS